MEFDDLLTGIGNILKENEIPYFAFGAAAMNMWVTPRTTSDVDLVVCIGKKDLPRLSSALNSHGFKMTSSLQRKLAEGRIINLPIGKTKLDLKLCSTDHDREAARRATQFEHKGATFNVASPEDIVLYKLPVWRRQDQADIERIVKERSDLDKGYIEKWIPTLEEESGQPLSGRWKEFS